MTDLQHDDGGNGRMRNAYCSGCPIPTEVADIRARVDINFRETTNTNAVLRNMADYMRRTIDAYAGEFVDIREKLQAIAEKIDSLGCQTNVIAENVLRLQRSRKRKPRKT